MLVRQMARIAITVLLGFSVAAAQQPAKPADPTTTILDAFRKHPIVTLGEGQHWNLQGHAYRLSLIRDPRLLTAVDNIVVEFGSARYQHVIDRYVEGGEVSYDELRHVWEDTTAANTVFDMPIYEEIFRTVRDVNRSSTTGKRLRVLLGDPPIDWTSVSSSDEILAVMYNRNTFAASLIRTEVLAKHRRALLLYADGHLFRTTEETVPDWMVVKRKPEEALVSQLEKAHPGTIFNIGAPTNTDLTMFQPDVANWRAPSITLLEGTLLGAAPFGGVYGLNGPEFHDVALEDQFDALLYLGPPSSITFAELPKGRCTDERYMKMRLARMALVPWGQYEISGLNAFCGRQ
jgi:hypothetical protein